jgi:Phage portal protein
MAVLDYFKRFRIGRRRHEPQRETEQYPSFFTLGQRNDKMRPVWKPTPRNLRMFSHTPMARRAINAIKNPISMLDWEVRPLKGIDENSELNRQIEAVTTSLASPNNDDSFASLIEQTVEDYLIGAAAIEMQVSGDDDRPLWLFPVDGLSIQLYTAWSGDPKEIRYAQSAGYASAFGGGKVCDLRNDELIYIRPNQSTATPFGRGQLEIAFDTITQLLGIGQFAGRLAANARPSIMLDLGAAVPSDKLVQFRKYWTDEIEGRGIMPITSFGTSNNPNDKAPGGVNVMRLFPEGDKALYLEYQEWLVRLLGASFDLSPQNFGIERDVNRNTSEVAEDRDWDQAIKPCASKIASHLTREAIHGRLGFSQIEFAFVGLDREDEKATSEIYQIEYTNNAITPNEHREKRGLPPLDNQWGDMVKADVEVAMNAARGTGEVDDPALSSGGKGKSKSATKAKRETRNASKKD